MGKECDLCNHSSNKFLSPRPFLQCTRCGIRCHKQHYDDKDSIQHCPGKIIEKKPNNNNSLIIFRIVISYSSSAKQLLVMCGTENEQKQWIAKLRKKLPRQQSTQDDSLR